ncbi:UNVERIFIED_CONTAM: hypothetical protein FKN15_068222 [Acipenser sinensis]
METWVWGDRRNELEDLLGGLEDQGWCFACGEFGHKVVCCPFQEEEEVEEWPAQRKKKESPSTEEGEEASASSRDPAAAAGGRVSRVLRLC